MAFENTITEHDLDPGSTAFMQNLRIHEGADLEPDLAVDGLTESILSRFLGIFGLGR